MSHVGRPPGLPKTGGRTKGTPNKSTSFLREKLAALGCDPALELVTIAQDSNTSLELKFQAYATLLPYVYPKRKPSSDAEERLVDPQNMSREEAIDLAKQLLEICGPEAGAAPTIDDDRRPTLEEDADAKE